MEKVQNQWSKLPSKEASKKTLKSKVKEGNQVIINERLNLM